MNILWDTACFEFPVLLQTLKITPANDESLNSLAMELQSVNLLDEIIQTIVLETKFVITHQVVPNFWKHFESNTQDTNGDKSGFYKLKHGVASLFLDYTALESVVSKVLILQKKANCEENVNVAIFFDYFRNALLSQLPHNFHLIVHAFYHISFKVFISTHETENDDDMMDQEECRGCGFASDKCNCQQLVNAFTQTNTHLSEMGLLDRIAGYTLTNLIQERILLHVQDQSRGSFDVSHIPSLESWLNTIVLNWLTRIFNKGSSKVDVNNESIDEAIKHFQGKLTWHLYEVYANSIIEQFFNIIIEFPDSQPILDDLKVCMEKIDLRQYLVKTLKKSIETKLLHPGVDSSDIITGYVATIKTMRHLDKSGILLQTVTEPVKEYLKSRQDTVRCVITSLIEESPTDLSEELARSETIKAEESHQQQDEMNNWDTWIPDPIDADPEKHSTNNRKSDIISMIVDIYGSKELFVNEYRNLLAERLLTQLDFNPEKEIRNLELLKLRFGEALLHSCEVMLKDISDSKRINTHIQSDPTFLEDKTVETSAIIVSSQFWPTFKKETMEFPPEINQQLEKYKKSYEAYKGNRTLYWTPLNGKVNIEIEIGDRMLNLFVSPAQATIIIHFQNQKEWHLEKLSSLMNMPQSVLRKRIVFWQSQGLIKESKDNVYVLNDEKCDDESEARRNFNVVEDDETESAMASASDQREEELQVFWSYIVGMLTNLDSMPLERIHQMLKMFASQGPGSSFASQEELKNFLQRKVREHKLVYAYGNYHLPK